MAPPASALNAVPKPDRRPDAAIQAFPKVPAESRGPAVDSEVGGLDAGTVAQRRFALLEAVKAMSKGGPVSETEEAEILEALKAGRSVRDVAGEFDRGKTTVSDIAKRNGLDLADVRRTKRAALIKSCYASEDRIKLIGDGLDKVATLLKTCDNARDLQALAMASAIWIDKRRLEEGPGQGDKRGEITMLFDKMREEEAAET